MRTAVFHVHADEAGQIARAVQPASRPLMIVIGLVVLLALFQLSQGQFQLMTVAIVSALAGAILTYGLRWYMRRAILQWIDRHAVCPAYLEWDVAGFRSGGCAHGEEGNWLWSAVSAMKESPDFFILKMGRCIQIVPKRALGGEAGAAFEQRLAEL